MSKTNFSIMELEDVFSYAIILHPFIEQKKVQLAKLKDASSKLESKLKSMPREDHQDKIQYKVMKKKHNDMLKEQNRLWREIQELNIDFQQAALLSTGIHPVDMYYIEDLIKE